VIFNVAPTHGLSPFFSHPATHPHTGRGSAQSSPARPLSSRLQALQASDPPEEADRRGSHKKVDATDDKPGQSPPREAAPREDEEDDYDAAQREDEAAAQKKKKAPRSKNKKGQGGEGNGDLADEAARLRQARYEEERKATLDRRQKRKKARDLKNKQKKDAEVEAARLRNEKRQASSPPCDSGKGSDSGGGSEGEGSRYNDSNEEDDTSEDSDGGSSRGPNTNTKKLPKPVSKTPPAKKQKVTGGDKDSLVYTNKDLARGTLSPADVGMHAMLTAEAKQARPLLYLLRFPNSSP
jgi:hypothetical protein